MASDASIRPTRLPKASGVLHDDLRRIILGRRMPVGTPLPSEAALVEAIDAAGHLEILTDGMRDKGRPVRPWCRHLYGTRSAGRVSTLAAAAQARAPSAENLTTTAR